MKKTLVGLFLVSTMGLASCGNAQTKEETNQKTEQAQVINKDIDVEKFASLVDEGNGLLLDVRTDGEFAAGHLKGATQIDYNGADFEGKIAELDKTTPVYVYCRSGARSGQAAKIMKEMGFSEVYNLEGGIMAWERAGKPVEK